MTLQEAQTKFSTIVGSITVTSSPAELLQKQEDLITLQNSLPTSAVFDVIADAIADFSPKLTGAIVQGELDALKGREAVMMEAASLLTQVEKRANADARTLTLEKPKLVAAALVESVSKIKELRDTAKAGDFAATASKAEAVLALLENVKTTIKSQ